MKVVKHHTSWGSDRYDVYETKEPLYTCSCGGSPMLEKPYLHGGDGFGTSYFKCFVQCTLCGNRSKAFNELDDYHDYEKKAYDDWNNRARLEVSK